MNNRSPSQPFPPLPAAEPMLISRKGWAALPREIDSPRANDHAKHPYPTPNPCWRRRGDTVAAACRGCVLAALLGLAVTSQPLRAAGLDQVRITEFAAVNDGPLADEDGDFSDWIEIHNAGSNTVNLLDWSLTDNPADLRKW